MEVPDEGCAFLVTIFISWYHLKYRFYQVLYKCTILFFISDISTENASLFQGRAKVTNRISQKPAEIVMAENILLPWFWECSSWLPREGIHSHSQPPRYLPAVLGKRNFIFRSLPLSSVLSPCGLHVLNFRPVGTWPSFPHGLQISTSQVRH